MLVALEETHICPLTRLKRSARVTYGRRGTAGDGWERVSPQSERGLGRAGLAGMGQHGEYAGSPWKGKVCMLGKKGCKRVDLRPGEQPLA